MLARLVVLSIVAFCLTAPLAADDPRQEGPPPAASEMMRLGLRGVHFVPNHGQWADDEVIYGFKSRGLDIAFRESAFTMHLSRERREQSEHSEQSEPGCVTPTSVMIAANVSTLASDLSSDRVRSGSLEEVQYEHLTLTVSFPGSNPVAPRGVAPQAARFNYYIGDDELRWASDVPSYGMIVYEGIYDGIDLHVMGAAGGIAGSQILKYEFHCRPGADHTQIRIHYDGIDGLCIDEDGDLHISTAFGTLRDGAPVVWQDGLISLLRLGGGGRGWGQSDGPQAIAASPAPHSNHPHPDPPPQSRGREEGAAARRILPARFELIDAATYRIALDAPPDPSLPFVIDPEIEWMYYLGGSGSEAGTGIAVDGDGNALVSGWTESTGFAGRNNSYHGGSQDAFALKVSPSGQLLWMTYLGGSGWDPGHDIAVDSAGNALVAGRTNSTDFAGANNLYHGGTADAFALKVNPSGQLQWMTYLGGTQTDTGQGIAVDGAGNALVTGQTNSTDFAGRNNSYHGGTADAFALKVSPSGQLQWMTYFGGGGDEGWGGGIAVDSAGNALVTGWTDSTNFAGRNNSFYGGSDAFALKVGPSGQLQWMTYLGGSSTDEGFSIAVDGASNALVTGNTTSSDFAGRNNSYFRGGDAFALKVSPSGQIQWMTYLGGSGLDWGRAIVVDSAGNALATSSTGSNDFAGANNSYYGGIWDAFALKVSPSGQLEWMTYLGGGHDDFGWRIAVDSAGNALVAGSTRSTNFAGRNNSYYGGTHDAFIVKLRLPGAGPRLSVDATCPGGGAIRISWAGATPNRQVAVIFARNTGSFRVPPGNPCAGTQLGLGTNSIQVAFQGPSGANGSRTINGNTGPGACGGYVQLLDIATCTTSNVARIE